MKIKLLLTSLLLGLLCYTGCKGNEPTQEDTSVLDPKYSTTVNVKGDGYVTIDGITIHKDNGTQVGQGEHYASYLVPYNGYMLLSFHNRRYEGYNDVVYYKNKRVNVGTAHELLVKLKASGYFEVEMVVTNPN